LIYSFDLWYIIQISIFFHAWDAGTYATVCPYMRGGFEIRIGGIFGRREQIMQNSALYSKSGNQKRCKSPVGPWRNSNVIQIRSRVLGYILDARAGAWQDRAAGSGGKKYSNPSRAEIRIRIDVSSDTCLHIENRYAVRNEAEGARLAWTGKKYSNFNTSRMWREPPLSYGVWTNDLFTVHGWMHEH